MKALVTGGAGFIGSHLVEALVTQGARVRALVRYTSTGGCGAIELLDEETRAAVDVVYGDLTRTDVVQAACPDPAPPGSTDYATVTVNATFEFSIPFADLGTRTLSATARMRCGL